MNQFNYLYQRIVVLLLSLFLMSCASPVSKPLSNVEKVEKINISLNKYKKEEHKDINLYKDINPNLYSIEGSKIYRLSLINLMRFYDEKGVKKIIVEFYGEQEELISEYYFWNDNLILALKEKSVYEKPRWHKDFSINNKATSMKKYYFDDGKPQGEVDPDIEGDIKIYMAY